MTIEFPEKAQGLFRPARYKVLHGGRGCLARGEKVIMADGSLRPIEEVQVGELMMGPDSLPRRVVGLHRGTEMMYRVKQTSAQDYVVNGAHVLVLRKGKSSARDVGPLMPSGNLRRPRGRYPDDPDEVEITVDDWLRKSHRWRKHFLGFRAGVLQFKPRTVAVDPYLLGLWLGDGLHRELMITSADQEIINWLREFAGKNDVGFSVSEKYGGGNRSVDVRMPKITGMHGRFNPVWDGFKQYGLPGNKHIPEGYLVNDEGIRLRLLAGIVDSDGHYVRGGYVLALANERLAMDVKRLADGLGFRTSIRKKATRCQTGAVGVAWRIGINGETQRVPCLLPRKRATTHPNKDKMLSMLSIEPVGVDDYFGVELDGDRRFLLGDGTVTHNSAKSWSVARALLLAGVDRPLRILCTREIQKSIKDSVHKLLEDQVQALNLGGHYEVLDTEIRGRNRTEFVFSGLQGHTIDSLKSYEGIDIVWVEEAQTVSKKSWDILIPTIRKPNSEIWITLNPELDTDETYARFVLTPPPSAWVQEMNYADNPWFPSVLDEERRHCQVTQPDDYDHIWLGRCKVAVEGAIYARELLALKSDGRYTHIPYDPRLKVHTVWDLGWNDSMAIALVQKTPFDLRILDYIEDSHKTLDWYAATLNALPYNWGFDWLPHDGFSKDFKTGKDTYTILKQFGRRVKPMQGTSPPIPRLDVELGIKAARMLMPRLAINKLGKGTARLLECLTRYRRVVPRNTNEPAAPLHDQYSHGADVIRHLALIADRLTNDEMSTLPTLPLHRPTDVGMGALG